MAEELQPNYREQKLTPPDDPEHRWLREVSSGLKASTHRFYEFNLRLHVIPVVGQRPVASFKRADCRDVIAACRAKQLKPSSLRGSQGWPPSPPGSESGASFIRVAGEKPFSSAAE